ncbi:family 78 glycoside hydrolase catalytic domain [Salipaludibacillus sp. CF4.18]|uniref:family 78 glycoside hydrolase catalytic domain n=1 Tax=Salipaludibacillus sp. CF4.18 TaxID=3373081 RepID=UPI003EE4B1D8
MFKIEKITCEYKENPMGIDVAQPRISWKTLSDQRGIRQKSYQIQIAKSNDFSEIIWDSGEVVTEESILVELKELTMESRKRYYYRIRVKNQHDESSGWSETHYWEMGLLNQRDWVADWISPSLDINGKPCPILKRDFQVDTPVKSARIYATALGLYELELNGQRIGDDFFTPGWTSYENRLQYQTYDVTDLLKQGLNEIIGLLGNGWYKGNLGFEEKSNHYGNRLALLAQLEIELHSGETISIFSDDSWKVSKSPILMSEIYHGETYDARIKKSHQEWKSAEVITYSKDILVAQENVPVKIMNEITPIELIETPKGEIVLDLGQNMVGWVRFSITGKSGQEVEICHAEVLDHQGNFYTENLRKAKQTVRYILNGEGKETFEPTFSFQGFRYIKLDGFESDQIQLENFTGIVLHSDLKVTGDFKCSDPMINQLQHNIVWGLKGNFLDVPTDCPQRDERLGWTGDAQMFIRTAAYLTNVAPFFTKWLHDLKVEQDEEGGVPFVVPNVIAGDDEEDIFDRPFSSAAWGDAAVICPWTLYLCYGDRRILEEQYESMTSWIEYIRNQGENEYLWNTGFHFGDWLALDSKPDSYVGATDRSYIATAFYAYSTSLVKKTAAVLGKEEDVAYYQQLETNIIKMLTDEFVTPNGKLAVSTQTGQILALMFDLLEGKAKDRAVEKLMELLEESDWHLTTGFVGTPYLNHVLSENDQNETAYKLLFQKDYPSWLYQITKGATTIWEHWDGLKENGDFWSADMNSFNHYAYGAIGDWLYRKVAGIELHENNPGYKTFTISPHMGTGLEWAEGSLESTYGLIRSYWKITDEKTVTMEVTVPANTTAEIILPNAKAERVKESGVNMETTDGILSCETVKEGLLVRVESGTFHFEYIKDGL